MAVDTQEVRDIVDFAPEGFLVTSFFLNCDASQFPSDDLFATSFNSTIHEAESRRKEIEDSLSHDGEQSLRSDLARIRQFVGEELDRTNTNGLAIFACSGQDFWEVVQLPTPIDSGIVFSRRPQVSRIATYLSHDKPTAILLTDRQNARILTMKGGEVREWANLTDFVPQRSMQGGWSQMRYQRRVDNFAKHHVDHAAELVLKLLPHYPFDWLILGTEVQVESDLKHDMHPYLKDRVIGEIHVRIDAGIDEILEKANELREQTEGHLIQDLMQRVQEYAGAGGKGTIGLPETLQALNEQKVHILVVQEGYTVRGSECQHCGMLFAEQRERCSACNEPATSVDNVVDSAIQRALELGSTIEVATEPGQLDPIQCIGSIMYY